MSKSLERLLGFDDCRSLVDFLQVDDHGLAVLSADVTQRRPHQMHEAQLDAGLRIGRVNRLGKTRQSVDARGTDLGIRASFDRLKRATPRAFLLRSPSDAHF